MTLDLVEKIVNAVLYEGYILYPYRPSSTKNQQRFTFGRVYPQKFSEAQHGAEPFTMQTQCLLESGADAPMLSVVVRFLQPLARDVAELPEPLAAWSSDRAVEFQVVSEMRVNGRIYQTWQEVMERTVNIPFLPLAALVGKPCQVPFSFSASRTLEPIENEVGTVVGVVARRQVDVSGRVELSAELTTGELFKVIVRILNLTTMAETAVGLGTEAETVLMRTFASTHTILTVQNGDFVSLMNPPAEHAQAAATCENNGTWPILVGDETAGERNTLLSSPIILYDYPEIAPESPGDLFDGLEIDEILTLRIMTMTDEEKWEMSHVDERARQILQRTEAMSADHLMQMHGTMRDKRPFDGGLMNEEWDFLNINTRLEGISVEGVFYKTGDRVRIQPQARADIMDIALAGKTAVIEAIEQDFENRVYLALVLDDDPGKELGMLRQPGHRFFYSPEEVELIRDET